MNSPTARRETLHKYLRESTEWQTALKAVMDSIHHGIPLLPTTVGKTLDVIYHHSESINPAIQLMKYYNRYIEFPQKKLLPGNHEEMRTVADKYSNKRSKDENYLYPYNRFYQLCVGHRTGWDAALSLLPSGHHSHSAFDETKLFGDLNYGDCTFWNDESLKLLVDLCRLCGQWQHSCMLFHGLKTSPTKCSPDLFAAVLHAYAIGRKWQEALVLFGSVAKTDKRISAEAYDRIIHACYRASKYDQVHAILNEILRIGLVPHESTVRMCLHSAEEDGQWRSGIYLLRSLQKNNLHVTMLMYEQVIRAVLCNNILCQTENAWKIALELIQELRVKFRSTPSPYLQELLFAAWIRRRQTTAESSYVALKQAEKNHVIKRNSRVVINAMLEKAFYKKNWGIFFAIKHRLYNHFPNRNPSEANLIIAATALVGQWWGAIAIWLKYKKTGFSLLCSQNKLLLLSCASKIHNQSLLDAITQELTGSNHDNVLNNPDSADFSEREIKNIDLLVQQSHSSENLD